MVRMKENMRRTMLEVMVSEELHLSVRQWQRVPTASVFSYILSAVHSSASKNPQSLTITFWPLLEKLKELIFYLLDCIVSATPGMSCRT